MIISIDCQALQTRNSRNRGIGNYSNNFLKRLIESRKNDTIICLANVNYSIEEISILENENPNVKVRTWRPLKDSKWIDGDANSRELSIMIYNDVVRSTKSDLHVVLSPFEGLNEDAIWSPQETVPTVAIFYDAIPLIFKDRYLSSSEVKKWYEDIVLKLKKLERIFAISKCSALDAERYLGIDKSKIFSINFGIDTEIYANKSNFKNGIQFALAVLGEDERKNKINLLKAWAQIIKFKNDLKLYVVYKQSESEIIHNNQIIENLNLIGSVEFLGYVNDFDLNSLYSNCRFTIFPSFYEGLGLPVLEAFKFSKAALVSNVSSLPELVENPNFRFDPSDVNSILDCIKNFINNPELERIAISESREVLERFANNKDKEVFSTLLEGGLSQNFKSSCSKKHLSKIYLISPIWPDKTGIANYLDITLHSFHTKIETCLVHPTRAENYSCNECGESIQILKLREYLDGRESGSVSIYNFGNSEFHTWQYELLSMAPGIVVLHDGYLSGMLWEYCSDLATFIRLVSETYSSLIFLQESYLYEPHKIINDFPLHKFVIEDASRIIVHSSGARELLTNQFSLKTIEDVKVIHHPTRVRQNEFSNITSRKQLCVFGFIANSKMFDEIIDGYIKSDLYLQESSQLIFVGEDLTSSLVSKLKKEGLENKVKITGFIDSVKYREILDSCYIAVQLRREFRGETSGTLLEVVSAGIPTICNSGEWISEYGEEGFMILSRNFSSYDIAHKLNEIDSRYSEFKAKALRFQKLISESRTPERYVDALLGVAENILSAEESSYNSEFFKLIQMQPHISKTDLADASLDSFPKRTKLKRIIFVVHENQLRSLSHEIVSELKNLLSNTIMPIFIVKKCEKIGYYETLHNILISNVDYIKLNIQEIYIRKTDADLLIHRADFEKYFSSGLIPEINKLKILKSVLVEN